MKNEMKDASAQRRNIIEDFSENEHENVTNESDAIVENEDVDDEDEEFYDAGEEIDDILDTGNNNANPTIPTSNTNKCSVAENDTNLQNLNILADTNIINSGYKFSHFEDMNNKLSTEPESNDVVGDCELSKQFWFYKKNVINEGVEPVVSKLDKFTTLFVKPVSNPKSCDDIGVEEKNETPSAMAKIIVTQDSENNQYKGNNGDDIEIAYRVFDSRNDNEMTDKNNRDITGKKLSANASIISDITKGGIGASKIVSNITKGSCKVDDLTVENAENGDFVVKCADVEDTKNDHASVSEKEEEIIQEGNSDSLYIMNVNDNENIFGKETLVESRETNFQKDATKQNNTTDFESLNNDITGEHTFATLKNHNVLKCVNFDPIRINKDDLEVRDEKTRILSRYCQVVLRKVNFDEYTSRKPGTSQNESIVSKCESARNVRLYKVDSDEDSLTWSEKKTRIKDLNLIDTNDYELTVDYSDRSKGVKRRKGAALSTCKSTRSKRNSTSSEERDSDNESLISLVRKRKRDSVLTNSDDYQVSTDYSDHPGDVKRKKSDQSVVSRCKSVRSSEHSHNKEVNTNEESFLTSLKRKSKIQDSDSTDSDWGLLANYSHRPRRVKRSKAHRRCRLKSSIYFESSSDKKDSGTSDCEKVDGENLLRCSRSKRNESSTKSGDTNVTSTNKTSFCNLQTDSKFKEDLSRKSNRPTSEPNENFLESDSTWKNKLLVSVSIPRIDHVINYPRKLLSSMRMPVNRDLLCEFENDNVEQNSDSEIDKDDIKSSTTRRRTKSDAKIDHLKTLVQLCGLHVKSYDQFWQSCRNYEEKAQRVFNFFKENGLKDAPTEENCKKFALGREFKGKTKGSVTRTTRSNTKSFVTDLKKSTNSQRR